MLKKLSGPILIIGSRVIDCGNDYEEVNEKLDSFDWTVLMYQQAQKNIVQPRMSVSIFVFLRV